ncbi:MAG TPA: PDZ domain-containing protein, partial [Mycoplana sp.]|nr:PDZ domain-containing protein [Mycoplana sp.]
VKEGQSVTVVLDDSTEYEAKVVGVDEKTDLALLKINNPDRKFTYVKFADDSKARVGDWVVAVGNPFGLGGTVTAGIISARGRNIGSGPYDDYLQIDAAVNRGNSGGPAFNLDGQVVGINTAIFSPSGGNVGIAFAIPASVAKDVVNDLMKNGKVERGWLGVQIQPVTKDIADSLGLAEAQGALVVEPQSGSPGEKAGVKKGDVVTALDGDTIKDARDLAKRVAAIKPGTDVELSIWRNGKSEMVKVEIGKLESDKQASASEKQATPDEQQSSEQELADLGISVMPADDGNGVMVAAVAPDSDAEDRGLKEGDRITSVNNQEVKSADDITKVIDQARKDGRSKALFQIDTDDGSRFVALPIDQG